MPPTSRGHPTRQEAGAVNGGREGLAALDGIGRDPRDPDSGQDGEGVPLPGPVGLAGELDNDVVQTGGRSPDGDRALDGPGVHDGVARGPDRSPGPHQRDLGASDEPAAVDTDGDGVALVPRAPRDTRHGRRGRGSRDGSERQQDACSDDCGSYRLHEYLLPRGSSSHRCRGSRGA